MTYQRTCRRVDALATARTRFVHPAEMARAMGFPTGYRLAGTTREQAMMLGNAVTPPAARDLLSCVAEAITRT